MKSLNEYDKELLFTYGNILISLNDIHLIIGTIQCIKHIANKYGYKSGDQTNSSWNNKEDFILNLAGYCKEGAIKSIGITVDRLVYHYNIPELYKEKLWWELGDLEILKGELNESIL